MSKLNLEKVDLHEEKTKVGSGPLVRIVGYHLNEVDKKEVTKIEAWKDDDGNYYQLKKLDPILDI